MQSCLIGLLISTLIGAPVQAAGTQPLGVVLQADRAHLGTGEAQNGASVFAGDRMTTGESGSLRVRLSAAQFALLPNSSAAMGQTAGGTSALLERGTLIFSSSAANSIEVRASEARIRPKTAQQTLAQITLVGPLEFLVTSQRGTLEVTIGSEVHTVPEATSYRVLVDASAVGNSSAEPEPAGRNRFLLIVLILIGAGTAYGLWRALSSPDRP
jgi:hypothetical protein